MKRFLMIAATFLLILVLLAGCSKSLTESPIGTEPSVSPTTLTAQPQTASAGKSAEETTPAETEGDTEHAEDPSSYSIDVVYTQQIERYYTAVSQQWDQDVYWDHEMSPMVAYYYDGAPLDNVGFTFLDLDSDGVRELIIGAIRNAAQDPLVFEIWTVRNGEPVMLVQSGSHNRYYLQYAEEDDLWSVAYEAENGAANHAVYYLQLVDGEFQVIQGVVFDAFANENDPWFMAYDLDWDVSNDTPIDEDTANAVLNAGRNTYVPQEYFPYSLYN